jgi:hypothetical protein
LAKYISLLSDQLDYEVELVAVIGKKGRRISVERAPEYVFGAPSFGQTPKRSRNLCEADPSLNLRVAA